MTSRHISILTSLAAAGAFFLTSTGARAACTTNAECPSGFVCEVVGAKDCPAYACITEPCPLPPECTPETVSDCVPGPCTTDADCSDGMVCYTYEYNACESVACAPGTTCPEPTCTATKESSCVPKYVPPCTVDADCGEGFACVQEQIYTCSGGGTTGSSGSGSTEPMPYPGDGGVGVPPECTVTSGTTSYCQIKETPCATSTDCPTDWSCELVGGYGMCSGVAMPAGIDGGSVTGVDGGSTCTIVPGTLQCVPPYSQYIGAPTAPGAYENAKGDALAAPSGTNDSTGTARSGDSGGCQMSTGKGAPAGAALLGLLGLAAFARRKRVQA